MDRHVDAHSVARGRGRHPDVAPGLSTRRVGWTDTSAAMDGPWNHAARVQAMSWTLWMCPSCGMRLELNDEAPVEAWCSACGEGMVPLQEQEP